MVRNWYELWNWSTKNARPYVDGKTCQLLAPSLLYIVYEWIPPNLQSLDGINRKHGVSLHQCIIIELHHPRHRLPSHFNTVRLLKLQHMCWCGSIYITHVILYIVIEYIDCMWWWWCWSWWWCLMSYMCTACTPCAVWSKLSNIHNEYNCNELYNEITISNIKYNTCRLVINFGYVFVSTIPSQFHLWTLCKLTTY